MSPDNVVLLFSRESYHNKTMKILFAWLLDLKLSNKNYLSEKYCY